MSQITSFLRSPWFAVSLGIAGLIIGYSVVVVRADVVGEAEFCPVEICQGNDCDKTPGCEHGICGDDCPGNCKNKHS